MRWGLVGKVARNWASLAVRTYGPTEPVERGALPVLPTVPVSQTTKTTKPITMGQRIRRGGR